MFEGVFIVILQSFYYFARAHIHAYTRTPAHLFFYYYIIYIILLLSFVFNIILLIISKTKRYIIKLKNKRKRKKNKINKITLGFCVAKRNKTMAQVACEPLDIPINQLIYNILKDNILSVLVFKLTRVRVGRRHFDKFLTFLKNFCKNT